jgi:Zn-finger in ubiquitin-hydrolases and other protein
MTITFTLSVLVCEDEKTLLDVQSGSGGSGSLFVAERIKLFQSETRALPRYAAIFVPSAFVDESLVELHILNRHPSVHEVTGLQLKLLSRSLLAKVHQFVERNFDISSIVCVRHHDDAPSDLIVVDLRSPRHETATAAALLDATNCATLQATEFSALKIVLLSEMTFIGGGESARLEATNATTTDVPTCPVCLHRIDPLRLGLIKPPNHALCSKFCPFPEQTFDLFKFPPCPRQRLLVPWPEPSHCVCCRTIEMYWRANLVIPETDDELPQVYCCDCALQGTLWACMTCGYVGCGRYTNKHAAKHFAETGHPYSLELATLRIWDYVAEEFAHRADLLECPCCVAVSNQHESLNMSSEFASLSSPPTPNDTVRGRTEAADVATASDAGFSSPSRLGRHDRDISQYNEKQPKKATMIGEEYEALLQSALEEQAQHYEGKMSHLLAALTAEAVDASRITASEQKEIDELRLGIQQIQLDIDGVSRELLDAQAQEAGYRATSSRLLREQQVAEDLLKKVHEETFREQQEGRRQMEELELQVADLTANQRMRDQFSQDEELSNAQIFGTASSAQKQKKKAGKGFLRRSRK